MEEGKTRGGERGKEGRKEERRQETLSHLIPTGSCFPSFTNKDIEAYQG